MTEEQMLQSFIDTMGNHSEMVGGIFIGAMLAFGAMLVVGFFGGLMDLLYCLIRRKIKGKKDKEQD